MIHHFRNGCQLTNFLEKISSICDKESYFTHSDLLINGYGMVLKAIIKEKKQNTLWEPWHLRFAK